MIQVCLALYPHVLATSLTLPIEMLRAAEAYAMNHNADAEAISVKLVASQLKAIESRAGIKLCPDSTLEQIEQCDLVIVPSIWRNPRPILRKNQMLSHWIKKQWLQGTTVIGVGTGNCFLADSGLLDGRPATTHWHYAQQFQRDYPLVELKAEFFITQSERLYCAASLNSLADIIVHVIHQWYGKDCAQHVERNFSHEIRKPYEEQRFLEGSGDRHPDELIAQIQFWLRTNVSSELTLAEVASQFGLSQRTFTRRFKLATGVSASHYWQQMRLETAKELLASSNLTIQDIAVAVGYIEQGHLTRLFKKHFLQTPSDYRLLVRKKLFG